MTQKKPAISFIGLGAMGFGMATNLIREGYDVTGFDVYQPTVERFRQAGGSAAASPAAAASGKNYCVCMVATAQQAHSVLFESEHPTIEGLPRGATLLLCSTVPSSYVQSLQQELSNRGRDDIYLVDCPVSGGTGRAADGTLSIMAGGSEAAIKSGHALLQAMSDPAKLYIVKGGIGAGSNMKMCHQVLAANQILSASEAMGFASHLGLDLFKTGEAIGKSEGASWMFDNRLPRILHPEFKPIASAVTIILKDASIITSEARKAAFPTLMTSAAEQQYFAALGRGYGPDDDASLLRLYDEGKGKIGPVKGQVQDETEKLNLVINLLKGIHLCSAAECLAFAHHLGLDLEQVFDLCVNAAGGSVMFSSAGRAILKALREGTADRGWASENSSDQMDTVVESLGRAVDEAQALKVPLVLGSQALNILRTALRSNRDSTMQLARGAVVKLWA